MCGDKREHCFSSKPVSYQWRTPGEPEPQSIPDMNEKELHQVSLEDNWAV
jgi:hypothetical protein